MDLWLGIAFHALFWRKKLLTNPETRATINTHIEFASAGSSVRSRLGPPRQKSPPKLAGARKTVPVPAGLSAGTVLVYIAAA